MYVAIPFPPPLWLWLVPLPPCGSCYFHESRCYHISIWGKTLCYCHLPGLHLPPPMVSNHIYIYMHTYIHWSTMPSPPRQCGAAFPPPWERTGAQASRLLYLGAYHEWGVEGGVRVAQNARRTTFPAPPPPPNGMVWQGGPGGGGAGVCGRGGWAAKRHRQDQDRTQNPMQAINPVT